MTFEKVRFIYNIYPASLWASENPVLLGREVGIEEDTGREKWGDGVTAWNALAYAPAYLGDALTSADIGVAVQAYSAALTAFATKTAPSGAVVGTTDTQTLTNKTLGATTLPGGGSIDSSGYVTPGGSNVWTIGSKAGSTRVDYVGGAYRFLNAGGGYTATEASTAKLTALGVYATNAAAVTGGLTVGQVYRTATGEVRIVV